MMQYLLSEEEYELLKKVQQYKIDLSKKKLQKLCTEICDTMPVQWGWGNKKDDPEYLKPWRCILTVKKEAEQSGDTYYHDDWFCDKCPVQDICPNPCKSWSK